MTASLVQRRCQHHVEREAVARCPECLRFFCRECIAEHDDRVLCTDCLAKIATPAKQEKKRFEGVTLLFQGALGALLIWFFFFLIGQGLLAVPARFHEGRWQQQEEAE